MKNQFSSNFGWHFDTNIDPLLKPCKNVATKILQVKNFQDNLFKFNNFCICIFQNIKSLVLQGLSIFSSNMD